MASKKRKKEKKAVDHPSHYNVGTIEVIDIIEDWGVDFHLGNVVKYVLRAPYKAKQLEDLEKAQWYLNRKIKKLKKANKKKKRKKK